MTGHAMKFNRRQLLGGGLAGASVVLGGCNAKSTSRATTTSSSAGSTTTTVQQQALRAAGSLPHPNLPAGTDQIPQIEHFVVVMMENHSFDNILGLIGRGDGFTLGSDGQPTNKNPDGHGNYIQALHMPTECQTKGVGNDWRVTHEA